MVNGGPSMAAQPGPGAVPKPAAAPPAHAHRLSVAPNEHTEQKRDLTSWWRSFKRNDKKDQGTSATFFTSCASVSGERWAVGLEEREPEGETHPQDLICS
nr:hypothetical protein CFP56_56970 [Quercus suber]